MSRKGILLLTCVAVFLYLSVNMFPVTLLILVDSPSAGTIEANLNLTNTKTESYSISGSGFNYPESAFWASMGLNIMPSSKENSWLRYYYPNMSLNFVSSSITEITMRGNMVAVAGAGIVQGIAGYRFRVTIIDSNPDAMGLEIFNPDGTLYYRAETKDLVKGNFTILTQ